MRKNILGVIAAASLTAGLLSSAASAAPYGPSAELVEDINPGALSADLSGGARLGSKLIFQATVSGQGAELFISDGTATGTRRLKDIRPGSSSASPRDFVTFDGKVYFAAFDGTDMEMWSTDGTAAGTKKFTHIDPNGNAFISDLTVARNKLYFNATSDASGDELWVTDGTPAGTQVIEVGGGIFDGNVRDITAVGSKVAFVAEPESGGNAGAEPWVSNGTAVGTHRIGNINTDVGEGSNPLYFSAVGSKIVFKATPTGSNAQSELYVSGGGVDDAVLLKDIEPGAGGSDPTEPVAFDGQLLFGADDGTRGTELWATDGTTGGTGLVRDINVGAGASTPDYFTVFDGAVYFKATKAGLGDELWRTKGSFATTKLVKDIDPGAEGSFARPQRVVGGQLFLLADTSVGRELWRTDGTTTAVVEDIDPGADDSDPVVLGGVANTVLFGADNGTIGEELHRYTARASKISVSKKSRYSTSTDAKKKIRVTITVTATGATPTGKVTLTKGSKTVGSGTLTSGRKKITLSKKLGKGTHTIKARYPGSIAGRAVTKTFTIKVR